MKRIISVLLAVLLFASFSAQAVTIDYNSLTKAELEQIISDAEAAIKKDHTVSSSAYSVLDSKIKTGTVKLMGLEKEPDWRWLDWSYTRDWNIVTVVTEVKIDGDWLPLNAKFNEEADGDFTLIYLNVGTSVVLDRMAEYAAGTTPTDTGAGETKAVEAETPAAKEILAQKGDKGDTVREIQTMLAALKYLNGKADGDFGNKSAEAVSAFQKASGLEATGEVDKATYNALKKAYDNRPAEISYISVSAAALNDAFQDNEASANKKYKDQYVEVTGKVGSVSKTFGSYYLRLDADEWGIFTVACKFSSDHEDELADLSAGSKVTVRGKCTGLSFIEVYVENCQLAK